MATKEQDVFRGKWVRGGEGCGDMINTDGTSLQRTQ
jgi:hypothetical protein